LTELFDIDAVEAWNLAFLASLPLPDGKRPDLQKAHDIFDQDRPSTMLPIEFDVRLENWIDNLPERSVALRRLKATVAQTLEELKLRQRALADIEAERRENRAAQAGIDRTLEGARRLRHEQVFKAGMARFLNLARSMRLSRLAGKFEELTQIGMSQELIDLLAGEGTGSGVGSGGVGAGASGAGSASPNPESSPFRGDPAAAPTGAPAAPAAAAAEASPAPDSQPPTPDPQPAAPEAESQADVKFEEKADCPQNRESNPEAEQAVISSSLNCAKPIQEPIPAPPPAAPGGPIPAPHPHRPGDPWPGPSKFNPRGPYPTPRAHPGHARPPRNASEAPGSGFNPRDG